MVRMKQDILERLRFGEAQIEASTTRVFLAYIPIGEVNLPVGALSVDRERNSVELVFVQEEYRRQGVGKALLAVACNAVGRELKGTGYRSNAGAKWAKAVGLKSAGEEKELSKIEAEGRGNALMVPLYNAKVVDLAGVDEEVASF